MKIIGITMGDPAGVGPEIVVKALADSQEFEADYVVYGAADILQHYIDQLGLNCKVKEISQVEEYEEGAVNVIDPIHLTMDQYQIGALSAKCGDAAYRYIERSIQEKSKLS